MAKELFQAKTLTSYSGIYLSLFVSRAFESTLSIYNPFAEDSLGKGVHLSFPRLSIFYCSSLLFKRTMAA